MGWWYGYDDAVTKRIMHNGQETGKDANNVLHVLFFSRGKNVAPRFCL